MSPKFIRTPSVPVLATSTSMAIVDVRDTRLVAVSVKNLDAAQTLNVTLRQRAHPDDDMTDAPVFDELTTIPALTARCITFDVGVMGELEVVGVASGAGLNASVGVKPDGGRR